MRAGVQMGVCAGAHLRDIHVGGSIVGGEEVGLVQPLHHLFQRIFDTRHVVLQLAQVLSVVICDAIHKGEKAPLRQGCERVSGRW